MTGSGASADADVDRETVGLLGRAGVGAGVTILVSVLPVVGLVAPAIGGGVASWTDDASDRGSRVGAAAGGLVALFSLPLTFVAVAAASTVSPAATVGVLALTLVGAAYVVGSGALGGYLADQVAADRETSRGPEGAAAAAAPVERLKRRYVDGELSDAAFERRLERLIAADRERERVEPTTDRGSPDGRKPDGREPPHHESVSRRRELRGRERESTGRER